MDAKEKLLGSIEELLDDYARWAKRFGGSRSDAAEEFYRELLNLAFGYHLRNMNREKGNYPGIDLGDEEARIAVQVTITETPEKVKHTLEQFLDEKNGMFRRYDRLIVVVAGDAKSKNGKYETKGYDFQPRRDIWDIAGLRHELQPLPLEKLREIEEFLLTRTSRLPKGEPILQLPTPEWRSSVKFLGREEELAWIDEELRSGTKPVVIAGLGGMGKTALVVKFRRRWEGHVYFATFRDTFTRTLADSVGQAIPVQERQGLNEEQTAELALGYLSRCEAGDLLIVDNAEVTGKKWRDLTKDPFYEKLRRLSMAVLMTTRHRDTGGKWLGRLEQEELREIFRRHEVQLSEGEMDALIDAVDGHTMTVDMIARTIRESWGVVSAEEILNAMKENTLNEGDFDEIETDHDKEQRQIYAHLRALFDLSGIGEDGRQALRCATLLPQTGMDAKLFRTALPKAAATEIKLLEKKGWVDLKEGLVTIHPVVRLVCRTELKPTEENCEDFLFGIKKQYDPKQYNHIKFRQMAELFENAANMLEDTHEGFWVGVASSFWRQVGAGQHALELALRQKEKREGKTSNRWNLAAAYSELGLIYGELGDHENALEYHLRALIILMKLLPKYHPALANSYNNVGLVYGHLGKHDKALEFKLLALKISEKVLPKNHPDLAICYNNVGTTYDALGEYEKALKFKLKDLAISECNLLGDHPSLATSYNNVGITYSALGDYDKALYYQQKALGIRTRALPEDHPDIARSFNNVGSAYYAMGNDEKALEHFSKAFEIWSRVLPENHPDIAVSCGNIALAFYNLERLDDAVYYMRRAAETANRSSLPESHPNRVNFNKWAKELEEEARQVQSAE